MTQPTTSPITLSTFPRPHTSIPVGPLQSGDPCTLVIFGAVGDLSRKKLMPAIYFLQKKGLLAENFRILGVGIERHDDASFRALVRQALTTEGEVTNLDEDAWQRLSARMFWISGDLVKPDVYGEVKSRLEQFEAGMRDSQKNRLVYLAVPPVIFQPIVRCLSESGVCARTPPRARPWRRVVVEKPFGHDLASAEQLGKSVLAAFDEHQVYRIDHYVGKETVQNVLVLRSANSIFEAVWERKYVSHVEITSAETVGVEERARYYESAGVVRDMFQNHLLQLLALTAMEPPSAPTADAVRDEKVKVLRAVRPLVENGEAMGAVRGQYVAGEIKGKAVRGYREEPGVSPTSDTATYAAMKVMVDTDRWRDIPFYIRSGKRMHRRVSEVALHFRAPRKLMYEPVPGERLAPNCLVLRIQPDDGVSLGFYVKVPGAAMALTPGIEVQEVKMDFSYADAFGAESHPAYETLLLDCMIGDATLFTRTDEVEAAWRVIDPLLNAWEKGTAHALPVAPYQAGSWGPPEADELLGSAGHAWRTPR